MEIAFQILSVLLLLASGWVSRRRGWISDIGTRELARVLLSLIAPCLIISSLVRRSADDVIANVHLPVLTLVLAMLGLGIGALALRMLPVMPDATRRSFLFQCMVNNYLFLPLPIVMFRYGDRGVAILLLASFGFEVAIWTVGVGLYAPARGFRERLRGLVSPAVIALIGSSAWVIMRDRIPALSGWAAAPPAAAAFGGGVVMNVCEIIGRATVPLSMIVAGSRIAGLRPSHLADMRVSVVALIRLLVVPLVFAALLSLIPLEPEARAVLLIVALMPTAVTAVVFSDRYGGDTDFVTVGLVFTHLLAAVTVPILLSFLE